MTETELAAIEARERAATPGPEDTDRHTIRHKAGFRAMFFYAVEPEEARK